MTSVEVKVILQNRRGVEFKVSGRYWSDGSLLVNNPRPESYAYQFLYQDSETFDKDDPSRLYWMQDTNSGVDALSPFRAKSVVATLPKPIKKRGK